MSDCTELTCPHHGWWNRNKSAEQPLIGLLMRARSRALAAGAEAAKLKVAGNPKTWVQVRFERSVQLKCLGLIAGMPVALDPEIPVGKFRLRYEIEVAGE